ncbi:hypothetical protein [Bacillus cereus]|uniref:hypothetical protein n=1 Tax=Bacillus cereus TaxID=1396 RepID=UPI0035C99818
MVAVSPSYANIITQGDAGGAGFIPLETNRLLFGSLISHTPGSITIMLEPGHTYYVAA